jgi:type III secretion protein R
VLSLLRNAFGLQQVPPNVVVNGLAIILSIYVMYPVGLEMQELMAQNQEEQPRAMDMRGMIRTADTAKEPLRQFLIRHTSDSERAFFLKTAQRLLPPERRDQVTNQDLIVVVPAFTVSELSEAFQIGFLIYLPFLIIDLVVSNILLAMGMMMLSPTTVSLPFKLLLFVLLDGWSKLIHGLVLTYR